MDRRIIMDDVQIRALIEKMVAEESERKLSFGANLAVSARTLSSEELEALGINFDYVPIVYETENKSDNSFVSVSQSPMNKQGLCDEKNRRYVY